MFNQCISSDPDLLALGFVLNDDFIRLWILLLLFLLFRKHRRIPVQLHLSLQLVCTGLADTIWTHKHQKTMNKQCVYICVCKMPVRWKVIDKDEADISLLCWFSACGLHNKLSFLLVSVTETVCYFNERKLKRWKYSPSHTPVAGHHPQ